MLATKHRADFLLDFEHNSYCNHGSYGAAPRQVFDEKNRLLLEMESNPDKWFRETAMPRYINCCKVAADFVGAKWENVTLVRNTTQGIQAVMNCLPHIKKCLVNSHTYNAMKNSVDLHARRTGCSYVSVDIPMPIESEDAIVKLFTDKLDAEPDIDFVLIDHISSASALVFPIKRLIDECKKRNIIVCIDGAHAPGQIDLNLEELAPDFYCGNLHKWAYACRGAAILWTAPAYHATMEPLTTSHLYKGTLHEKFYQQGTDDQTNFFAVPAAIEYHRSIGFDKLYVNADELLEYARKRLCTELGCEMYPVPASMEAPFMKIVKLPPSPKFAVTTEKQAKQLFHMLILDHGAIVKISLYNGGMWLRLSANVYNKPDDYDFICAKLKELFYSE